MVVLTPPAAGAPSPSPSAQLQPGEGVSVVPAQESTHRSASGTFLELGTVPLGRAIDDTVVVKSTFSTPQRFLVYPADATPAVGGGFGFGARTDVAKQVGAWLRVGAAMVDVPAQGQVRLAVRVLVPNGVTGGEYVGAVIAESAEQAPSTGVQTRTRFAMAVYLRVPGGASGSTPGRGRPDGRFDLVDVDPGFDGDKACPRARYRNDSQDILDPQVTVTTRGLLGSGKSYTRTRTGAVLPGAEATVALPCIRRPAGPGSVSVTLRTPRGERTTSSDYTWLPIPVVVSLLLLLLLVGALVTTFVRGLRRRRHAAPGAEPNAPVHDEK